MIICIIVMIRYTLKCERERLTCFHIRQATLPHNTGGQACTFSEDSLRFDCRIAAKRPPIHESHDRGEHITPSSAASAHGSPAVRGRAGDLGREKEG